MSLSTRQIQAIASLADAHCTTSSREHHTPRADQSISLPGAAHACEVGTFWTGGIETASDCDALAAHAWRLGCSAMTDTHIRSAVTRISVWPRRLIVSMLARSTSHMASVAT